MKQMDRMNSSANIWEADPWDASDEVADLKLAGFQDRAARSITWTSLLDAGQLVFGTEVGELRGFDV